MKEPAFINRLFSVFLKSVEWISVKAPPQDVFAYRCRTIDGAWEIAVSPWVQEFYGGKKDGGCYLPTYGMNLMMLADEFDTIKYIGFDSSKLESHIEGTIDNDFVNLIFRRQPVGASKPKRKLNVFTGEVSRISRETVND